MKNKSNRQTISKKRASSSPQRQRSNIVVEGGKVSFKKKHFVLYAEDLTDAEWRDIAASSPLPPTARASIAAAVAEYRNFMLASRTSLETKRIVNSTRGYIKKLLGNTAKLERDQVFLNVGLVAVLSRSGPIPGDLTKLTEDISLLDQVLADAQDRMSNIRRGRKSLDPLKRLIQRLVWVQAEATRGFVKRSNKTGLSTRYLNRFVHLCARSADPKITGSIIESALTQCISEHHKIREEYGFNTATGRRLKIRQKRVELPRTLSR